jgi:hypothetical protein
MKAYIRKNEYDRLPYRKHLPLSVMIGKAKKIAGTEGASRHQTTEIKLFIMPAGGAGTAVCLRGAC